MIVATCRSKQDLGKVLKTINHKQYEQESESESEKFTGDTPNDIISPRGSDGGEISPLNARVKLTWTHSHHTFQQRR